MQPAPEQPYPLAVEGVIVRDRNNLRVMYNHDFVHYYQWLIEQHFKVYVQSPAHSAHTTIINANWHKDAPFDLLNKWNGAKVLVTYDPFIYIGGSSRDFRNFYMKVRSNVLNEVAEDFKISPKGFHCTIANTKGLGPLRPNFGTIITIK